MEIIKRKILLEDYTSRKESNWGNLTVTAFTMNVFFSQDADDMGIDTALPFLIKGQSTPTYQPLLDKLNSSGYTFEFMNGATTNVPEDSLSPDTRYTNKSKDSYYINGQLVTGMTEDRLDNITSYDKDNPYKPLFNLEKGQSLDFEGSGYTNATKVIDNNQLNPITYMINGDKLETIDLNDPDPQHGIIYQTYTGRTRVVLSTTNQDPTLIPLGEGYGNYTIDVTEFYYKGEGFNETNTVLSADTKEEYLFGITMSPRVDSDLFVDRGRTTIIQSHMQLSEITNMGELINYGNGYYKIQK